MRRRRRPGRVGGSSGGTPSGPGGVRPAPPPRGIAVGGGVGSSAARSAPSPCPRLPAGGLGVGVRGKVASAGGGCLGANGRGRARYAAKSRGEARAAVDPRVPEWSNPPGVVPRHPALIAGGQPGELKHLSTPRNRNHSPSSGERTGRSPNRPGLSGDRAYARGGVVRPRVVDRPIGGPPGGARSLVAAERRGNAGQRG